ncbi:SDR family NAD(P)-dependent oxidoreductase, partial [bacterium]|nr:SDR family NAD(P)-dependent oxidoreductase [bacterium]
MNIKIKTVLITGASKGIGLGIVKALLEDTLENYRIILIARNSEIYDDEVNKLRIKYKKNKI